MSTLDARLSKLKRRVPAPEQWGRVIRIVAGEKDRAEAKKLLQAEGYNPEHGDLAIFRIIVSPTGQEPWPEPSYIMRRGDQRS